LNNKQYLLSPPFSPSRLSFNNATLFQRSTYQGLKGAPIKRTVSNGYDPKAITTNPCQGEEYIDTKPCDDQELKPMMSSKNSLEDKFIQEKKEEMIRSRKMKHDSIRLRKSKEMSCYMLLSIVLLFILTHSFRLAFKIYEILMPNGITSENYERCFTVGR
jgi:hypothetical protein